MKYKIVAVEPNKSGYRTDMSFPDVQEFVGGYVQQVNLYDDKYAVLNEDGYALKLPHNRNLILQDHKHFPLTVVGNFVVVKLVGGQWVSMSENELKEAEFIFRMYGQDATIFI